MSEAILQEKPKRGFFAVLQRVGRAFMLPIALLPIAGLLLGIGSSLTNASMLEAYGLVELMGEGTISYAIFSVLASVGSVIFDNLPLLFAIGVALGMAENEKATAALSAAIAFFVMHKTIGSLLVLTGKLADGAMPEGTVANVVGIQSLQMGVFGGIVVGLGVAYLTNRFYKIRLPQVISFFGGTRFIPIISTVVYLLVGVLMFFLWPFVQNGIYALGDLVLKSGYAGTLIYGFIERILIPFGLPGAALAMYTCARPEKKKVAGGLLLSAALTAMLTGITEPLEFTFLFVAPALYVIHSILAGLAYMLMHALGVGVGMTFSGGIIDLTLFGIIQGNAKTNWLMVPLVGIFYFVIYFFLFRFLIRKLNYMTPGREDDLSETKLYTRADYNAKKEGGAPAAEAEEAAEHAVSALILSGLGGKDNIAGLDCCATRLRVTVKDPSLVVEADLRQSGAAGIIKKGSGVQVVYGPQVSVIKSELEDYLKTLD